MKTVLSKKQRDEIIKLLRENNVLSKRGVTSDNMLVRILIDFHK